MHRDTSQRWNILQLIPLAVCENLQDILGPLSLISPPKPLFRDSSKVPIRFIGISFRQVFILWQINHLSCIVNVEACMSHVCSAIGRSDGRGSATETNITE